MSKKPPVPERLPKNSSSVRDISAAFTPVPKPAGQSSFVDSNEYFSASSRASNQSLASSKPSLKIKDTGMIGISSLPEREYIKHARRGFQFTVAIVGEAGLGKSTLMEALFKVKYAQRSFSSVDERINAEVLINPTDIFIEEKGIKVRLTIVETPGYADSITGKDQFSQLSNYIDNQFNKYYNDETSVNRKNMQDHRVHCILYFINPSQNGLKPIDVEFIKAYHEKANIIPVIAKSDMLTVKEMNELKAKLRTEFKDNGLKIYTVPNADEEDLEDPEYKKRYMKFKDRHPFAVIGPEGEYDHEGRRIRGRCYPWGIVDVEDENNCDFKILQELLMTHMTDLVEFTHDVHYEKFRANKMFEDRSLIPQFSTESLTYHRDTKNHGNRFAKRPFSQNIPKQAFSVSHMDQSYLNKSTASGASTCVNSILHLGPGGDYGDGNESTHSFEHQNVVLCEKENEIRMLREQLAKLQAMQGAAV